jgi:hypothetical protein
VNITERKHDEMQTGHELLSFDETTIVEWRRQDGTVLDRVVAALGPTGVMLLECGDSYEVYARSASGVADWRRIAEVDPAARTISRFDL